jgi:hypothetical protein
LPLLLVSDGLSERIRLAVPEGVLFPVSLVVFLVGQNVSDVNFPPRIIYEADNPKLVAAYIENGLIADLIRPWISLPHIGEAIPLQLANSSVPGSHGNLGSGMFGVVVELAELS